jgi:hypothetical protein
VARVFISYAREDQPAVRPLAEGLEQAAHEVWWDPELRGGERFRDVIERRLESADVVLVVWSKRARASRWVVDEAEVGVQRGSLLPVRIDAARLPLGFGGFNVLDFSDWGGNYNSEAWRRLLEEIRRVAAAVDRGGARPRVKIWGRSLAVGAAAAGVFGLLIWTSYSFGAPAGASSLGRPILESFAIALVGSAPVALWSGIEVKRAGFESARLVARRSLVWIRRGGVVALVALLAAIAAGAVREQAPRAIAFELGRIFVVTTLISAAGLAAVNLLWFVARQVLGRRTG